MEDEFRTLKKKLHKIKMRKKKLMLEKQNLDMEEEEILEELKNMLLDKEEMLRRGGSIDYNTKQSSQRRKENSRNSSRDESLNYSEKQQSYSNKNFSRTSDNDFSDRNKDSRNNNNYQNRVSKKSRKRREEIESEEEENEGRNDEVQRNLSYQDEKRQNNQRMEERREVQKNKFPKKNFLKREDNFLKREDNFEKKEDNFGKRQNNFLKEEPKAKNKRFEREVEEKEEIEEEIEEEIKEEIIQENSNQNSNDKNIKEMINSKNFKERVEGFQELIKWDGNFSKNDFVNEISTIFKEKNVMVATEIIKVLDSIIEKESVLLKNLDQRSFLLSFCELMDKIKSKKQASLVFAKYFKIIEDKQNLNDEFLELLSKKKPKLHLSIFTLIFYIMKSGKIDDLNFLQEYFIHLENNITSSNSNIKKMVFNIYKEAYLWMGSELRFFLKSLRKFQMMELTKFFDKCDPKDFKTLYDENGKVKKFDAFENAKPVNLPDELYGFGWVETIFKMKTWKEKQGKLEIANECLENIIKLNSKTESWPFTDLAKKILNENIVLNKILVLKMLSYLSSSLRKNFKETSQTIFPILLENLKLKNKTFTDQIFRTVEKFFLVLSFDDVFNDIKGSLTGEKSNNKILNTLKLLMLILNNTNKIESEENIKQISKLAIGQVEVKDIKVRECAFQLLGTLLKKFEDCVEPLIEELDSKKIGMIRKYSR